ncbi:hypothetical protein AYO44_07140 [Planctomycetaceae bacterium SCGC AG-212-F19]|nr:hypothetical protein AYO44_07140 [Planctomycetaceae bacterium SCGC AG-212-F19]
MSELTCDDARLLFSDLLAGAAASADLDQLEAHLSQCSACRDQGRAYARLHRALSERAALADEVGVASRIRAGLAGEKQAPAASHAGRSVLPVRVMLVAAGLLLAVGAVFWFTLPAPAQGSAQLESVEGEVYIVTGQQRQLATAGQMLRAGQGLETVGEESLAVLVDRQALRLVLGPDSTLGNVAEGPVNDSIGWRVSFVAGSLIADGTQRPGGRPMIVETPQAKLVAQSAKMSLVNSPEATRVDLESGSLRFTRRSDGEFVDMAPGTFSIARAQAEPMGPMMLAAQFSRPRANLPASLQRVWALAFDPNGGTLVTGGSAGEIRVWDPTEGAAQNPVVLDGSLNNDVRAFAFSRDGRLLAAGGDSPPRTKIWDWNNRKEIASLPCHRTWIEALAFSPDAKTLIVAGAHGQDSDQIHVWDIDQQRVRKILDGHAKGVWCVTFSPDGQTLASAGRDGIIKLWDFARLQLRQTLTGHTSEVYALAFSPDGAKLVSSSRDKTVKLWDLATGQELHSLLGHSREVRGATFAPDGQTVASAGQDGTVRLWRVADGLELATFKLPGSAFAVAFSPDGRTLAAGGMYKTVQLWDLPADAPPAP